MVDDLRLWLDLSLQSILPQAAQGSGGSLVPAQEIAPVVTDAPSAPAAPAVEG